jgi:hypothetical protein
MGCHLSRFTSFGNRDEITKPFHGSGSGEAVGQWLRTIPRTGRPRSLSKLEKLHPFRLVSIEDVGIDLGSILSHVGLPTDKSTKKGADNGLRCDNFVVHFPALQMEKSHANRLGLEYWMKRLGGHAVLEDKSFKDVKTLGGELVYRAIPMIIDGRVGGIFDEA